jgi:hypothetical protein
MNNQTIKCPYCNKEFPLTETISKQLREDISKEFEEKNKKRDIDIAEREKDLSVKEEEIKIAKKSIEEEIETKVKIASDEIKKEAKQEATKEVSLDLEELKEQIEDKNKKLEIAAKAELDLRKKARELEESKKNIELEIARKVDEEREKIKESALKSVEESHRLKIKEKDKKMEEMTEQIIELKRKAEQGSQQTQGEVLELELEDILNSNFTSDNIKPVPKGIKGADVLQEVISPSGQYCGTILWESKRTKSWSDSWIEKLKDDQKDAKADTAVLVSITLPKGCKNFSSLSGVWVICFDLVMALATVLRTSLLQLSNIKLLSVGKNEKMEILYKYLSGPEFSQKVESIIETFKDMKEGLEQEKRAINKIWAKRDKQIEKVINSTSGMYGDMEAIIGASSMQKIEALELKSLPSGAELTDEEET